MKGSRLNKRRVVLGITGSFGSGKSTVSKIFKSLGSAIIDADKIAHVVIRKGSKTYKKIVVTFGRDILTSDGGINHSRLAEIVFSSKALARKINGLIHPEILRIIKEKLNAKTGNTPVVLDAPLLIESGLKREVDYLIVVKASRAEQIKRLLKKTNLSEADILRRIKLQMPLSDKIRMADFVIDNSGSIKETKKQVKYIRRRLWKS